MQKPLPVQSRKPPSRQPSIALALGGGGARGLAHILMLEVFDEFHVKPKIIAGTSIGAIFGAAYAAGLSAAEVRAMAEETLGRRFDLVRQLFSARAAPVQKLLSLLPVRSALINAEALLDLILPARIPARFDQLQIPFSAVATDLGERSAVVLDSGLLKPAIAASISIPVIFAPVVRDGRTMVDGGLVNPLPFDLLHGTADIVIAIDVSGAARPAEIGPRPSAVEVLMQSVQILEKSITREKLKSRQPDIYIDVELDKFGALEFYKPREILAAAAPAKDLLRRQLERMLSAETLEIVPPPPAKTLEGPRQS